MQQKTFPKNGIIFKILEILPAEIVHSIKDELCSSCSSLEDLFEIRLRADGMSSLLLRNQTRKLALSLSKDDIGRVLTSLTEGALYAYRDSIIDGYISPMPGLRVGICGKLRYDGGASVGVSDVRSLIFRISHKHCDFEDELYSIWKNRREQGMLIYSPPCGGKTTAIRSLVGKIGLGGKRVCVVDERCEFIPEEYKDCEVDILQGYKKSKGIEIAVRTLGAELVVVDEIGAEEAGAVLSSLTLGVPFLATAHARFSEEILHRPVFTPFMESGVFSTLVGIRRTENSWKISSTSLPNIRGRVKLSKEALAKQ